MPATYQRAMQKANSGELPNPWKSRMAWFNWHCFFFLVVHKQSFIGLMKYVNVKHFQSYSTTDSCFLRNISWNLCSVNYNLIISTTYDWPVIFKYFTCTLTNESSPSHEAGTIISMLQIEESKVWETEKLALNYTASVAEPGFKHRQVPVCDYFTSTAYSRGTCPSHRLGERVLPI